MTPSKMPGRIYSLPSCLVMAFGFVATDSFDQEDIHFARFYKAATQTTRKALAEVFGLMFHRYGVWTTVETWPLSVAEFCFGLLRWSNRKYRESFNADERTRLDKPLISAHLDVSLLTKMINKLFTDFKFPESFIRALRELKNVRNRVCHEQLAINEAELRNNMEDLKQLLEEFFNETSHFFGVDVAELNSKYLHEIDEITCAPITEEGEVYFNNVFQFQEELVGKFITHGRKELMDHYSKLKNLNPFTWMRDEKCPELLLDKVFTPLHINEQGRSIDLGSLLMTELLDEQTQESLKILPSVMILSGVAGCGKSSLCRYILYDWRTRLGKVGGLRQYDIVIFIEMRNVKEGSLVPFLQKTLLRETCRLFDERDIVNTLQMMNVLYVIDGMDEATKEGRDLVEEIFSVLGTARIIITTRPEFVSQVGQYALQYHQQYLKLHIQGFTVKGMRTFSSKILRSCEPDEAKCHQMQVEFYSYLRTTGRALGDHLKLPLTLALLVLLWKDDKSFVSNIKTSAGLYFELFKLSTMKLISRLQTKSSLHHIELENVIGDWLLELGKEAYEMLKEGSFVLGSRSLHLMSFCSKHGIDPVQTMSAFLVCEVQEHLGSTNYSFAFLHKSQMEYLASLFIVKHLTEKDLVRQKKESIEVGTVQKIVSEKNKDEIILELNSSRKWLNTIVLTLGNLCREKCVSDIALLELIDVLNKFRFNDIATVWKIIQESYMHPVVTKVYESFSTTYFWKPDCNSLSDPADPASMMILKSEFRPMVAMIRIIGSMANAKIAVEDYTEERTYTNLYPVLRKLSASPEVHVGLRLDQHYYCWGNAENSDEILVALVPGGWLMTFMGHLAMEGAKAFSSVTKLREGYVRVSDMSVLQTLAKSLATKTADKIIKHFTIRVDVPPLTLVPCLPRMDAPCKMSVILYGISDESVAWAAQLIASLRESYEEIDLVASFLTPAGGKSFLTALVTECIQVTGVLTVRSTHGILEEQYKDLEAMIQGKLRWLW